MRSGTPGNLHPPTPFLHGGGSSLEEEFLLKFKLGTCVCVCVKPARQGVTIGVEFPVSVQEEGRSHYGSGLVAFFSPSGFFFFFFLVFFIVVGGHL